MSLLGEQLFCSGEKGSCGGVFFCDKEGGEPVRLREKGRRGDRRNSLAICKWSSAKKECRFVVPFTAQSYLLLARMREAKAVQLVIKNITTSLGIRGSGGKRDGNGSSD